MNTGVQDVHNLAWKLAGVLGGWAGPAILDSYQVERRPIARSNADRSLENSRMVGRINRAAERMANTMRSTAHDFGAEDGAAPGVMNITPSARMFSGAEDGAARAVAASKRYGNVTGMDLGFRYEEGALVPDGTAPPEVADPVIDYAPTARPGHRAPHLRLERSGRELSTLDLFDGSFTLLAGAAGPAWRNAARTAARKLGVPLQAFTVGAGGDLEDPERQWADLYGVGPSGAVLVRPDGHVGWRASGENADCDAVLDHALRRIVDR
jgi:hypothetical protein